MPKAMVIPEHLYARKARLATFTLAGTVTSSGAGVRRELLVMRYGDPAICTRGWSATDGTFSFTLNGNANDKYTVIAVGQDGEQSQIFNAIAGAA